MRTVALLTRLRAAVEAERWQETIQLIFEVEYHEQSPEVVQLCGPLLDKLREHRLAKEQAAVTQMRAGVKKAGEALLAAKEAKELDQVVADLVPLMQVWRTEDTVTESEELHRGRGEVSLAEQYVRRWQEYLLKRASGNESEAAQKMQSLADQNFFPIVPRSEVLTRAIPSSQPFQRFQPEVVIKDIVARAKSLDDVDGILNAIQNWEQEHPRNTEIRAAAERVSALQNAYRSYRAGQYSEAFEFFARRPPATGAVDEQLSSLRQQFLVKLLPHYLGSSEISEVMLNELPSEYLSRLAKEAIQKRNWPIAVRAMETFRVVAFNGGVVPTWVSGDIIAIGAMAKAEKQERAGQFADAVASYRAALECDGQNVPVDVIGQRLAALRKSHPEAFAIKPVLPRPGGPARVE